MGNETPATNFLLDFTPQARKLRLFRHLFGGDPMNSNIRRVKDERFGSN